jgi:NADH:ubiquinone oxidoreductase subunit C
MFRIINNVFNKNENILVYSDVDDSITNYKVIILKHEIRQVALFLKLHSLVRALNAIDISVVDRVENKIRFSITYHLQSFVTNTRYSITT